MKATITRYTLILPDYEDWYKGTIKKVTKTCKTEAEAEAEMVAYAKANPELVEKAPAHYWNIKKVVRHVEVDD